MTLQLLFSFCKLQSTCSLQTTIERAMTSHLGPTADLSRHIGNNEA